MGVRDTPFNMKVFALLALQVCLVSSRPQLPFFNLNHFFPNFFHYSPFFNPWLRLNTGGLGSYAGVPGASAGSLAGAGGAGSYAGAGGVGIGSFAGSGGTGIITSGGSSSSAGGSSSSSSSSPSSTAGLGGAGSFAG